MIEEIKKRINESLIKSVEILEGRVPYGLEWKRYLDKENHEGGLVLFYWKKRLILKVHPPESDDVGTRVDLEEIDLTGKENDWKNRGKNPPGDDPTMEDEKWKKG